MNQNHFSPRRATGVALVIVLAFLVLLSGVVVAFLLRATSGRKLSDSSLNEYKADELARSASEIIVGDLIKEIVDGSNKIEVGPAAARSNIYLPQNAANMLPARNVTFTGPDPFPNLVRISKTSDTIAAPGVASRASASNSAANASLNSRFVSGARWNKHLLLPRLTPGTANSDVTPVANFPAPDWIYVSSESGSTVVTAPSPKILGRYAYAIYDEGGLLDMNAAGYPSSASPAQSASKTALAFADLRQLPVTPALTAAQIDNLVGWRNFATLQTTGSFGAFTGLDSLRFYQFIRGNSEGFLTVPKILWNQRTDQLVPSRAALIELVKTIGIPLDALQYLTHYSREINQPSYIAPVQVDPTAPQVLPTNLGGNNYSGFDKLTNPDFLAVRVENSFTRNDGSTAEPGQPLVNKRFPLNRLAWITWQGPSANRSQSDPDIQALMNDGITSDYLQKGTAEAIRKHFGLSWDASGNRWVYDVHAGGGTGKGIIMHVGRPSGTTANSAKFVQDAGREPDFFELLKAGISVGSLGKAAVPSNTTVVNASSPNNSVIPSGYSPAEIPANLRYNFDSSVDYQIIQIGANILSEVNPTSYPIRVAYDDGSARGLWEFQGVTDLPYLSYIFNGVIRERLPNPAHPLGGNQAVDGSPHQAPTAQVVSLTDPGNAYMVQVPAVWNPYDPNGTAGVLRPTKFRVVVDSNDPLSASGDNNLPICRFAAGSKSTGAGNAGNDGTGPPNPKYSIENDVTVGKSPDRLANAPGGAAGSPVHDAVTFNDSNGALYREPTLILDTTTPGNATRVNAISGATPSGNIKSKDANPLAGSSIPAGTDLAPLILGSMPLAFSSTSGTTTTTYYTASGYIALAAGTGDNRVYFTYRLQFQDPTNNNWVTYDIKYGRTTHGLFGFQNGWHTTGPGFSPCVVKGPDWYNAYSWASAIDPRSARFGLVTDTFNGGKSRAPIGWAPADTGWIFNSNGSTTTVGITYPVRQEKSVGFGFANLDINNVPKNGRNFFAGATLLNMGSYSSKDIPYPGCPPYPNYGPYSPGWTAPVVLVDNGGRLNDVYMCAPGMYAQNHPGAPFYLGSGAEPCYYADPDGVVRRAAGAYVPSSIGNSATSTIGLPTASINGYTNAPQSTPAATATTPSTKTPFTQSQSRPLLLHRPFRTVAEMSYTFRDLPWKNLDFFTPESGDAALLDIFCINETSDPNCLVAGKVNLNTRQAPVLASIVSGAYVDDPKVSDATVGAISNGASTPVANAVATALTARTADPATYGPLQNVSELVGKWKAAAACAPPSGISYSPTNPVDNWGIDLPLASGYKDGKTSYTGFSGETNSTTPAKDISSAYSGATFSTSSTTNTALRTSMSQVQRFREAPMRALTSAGQTRVWNLLLDVVAQTGRYPKSANNLGKFVVEGEQHCWVHVAIDRYTGRILDKQIEVVQE